MEQLQNSDVVDPQVGLQGVRDEIEERVPQVGLQGVLMDPDEIMRVLNSWRFDAIPQNVQEEVDQQIVADQEQAAHINRPPQGLSYLEGQKCVKLRKFPKFDVRGFKRMD